MISSAQRNWVECFALDLPVMIATTGVYFRHEDYASFWVRALVDVIDFSVFAVFCIGLVIVMISILPLDEDFWI